MAPAAGQAYELALHSTAETAFCSIRPLKSHIQQTWAELYPPPPPILTLLPLEEETELEQVPTELQACRGERRYLGEGWKAGPVA